MSRTIVIAGCNTGFGYDAALRFARQGDRVYATMRGVDGNNREAAGALRSAATDEGIDLRVLEMDVTSDESVRAAAETVLAESCAPHTLINNAGQMYMGITETFTPDELARQLDVNVVGPMNDAAEPLYRRLYAAMGHTEVVTIKPSRAENRTSTVSLWHSARSSTPIGSPCAGHLIGATGGAPFPPPTVPPARKIL